MSSPAAVAAKTTRSANGGREPVGLLVGVARRAIKQAVGRRVGPLRLTPQQFWLLLAIQEGRATSLGELAARLGGDQPTASRVVAALARRRLVRVEEDAADRRRARLTPAPAAEAMRADLAAIASEIRAAIVQGMDEREQDAVRAGLRKVIANMERLEHETAPKRRARTTRRRRGG
jgi:DNA-binding MarR family transcriptional regulator